MIILKIIANLIPSKDGRHRMRKIAKKYSVSALAAYIKIKCNNTEPHYYFSICAIAKNEGRYFAEWIEYHKGLGCEKFYIYDNESTDNTRAVLQPYIASKLVEYNFIAGKKKQRTAYDKCLRRHRFDSRWIAFIDLDEFIVPMKNETIPEFLQYYEDFSGIEINWLIYGSDGQKQRTDGFVIDRFRSHSLPNFDQNRHIKSIINPRKAFSFIGAHEAACLSGKTVDTNKKIVHKTFWEREPLQDKIRINHYAVKSYEEFLEKRSRGNARKHKLRNLDFFDQYNRNEVKNDTTMDKYIAKLKKVL
ncbi:MAG: glycosyltransferase family 92 protein [Prevotellaceae bacterium]|jgi:hypothetical protein|nr:glycosyltransferase family 92 protein [Prevotellaceae bacterium]